MLLHLIVDQLKLPALVIARGDLRSRSRDRIEQGGGQARHLIGRHHLARARAPSRTLQLREGLGDLSIEAIFDDAQRQGLRQKLIFGAADLHQIAAIVEPLPPTGILVSLQAGDALMTSLLEHLDPPGPAKAGVLQNQRVGRQGGQQFWDQGHFRLEAGSQHRPQVGMRANLKSREQTQLRKRTLRAWLVVLGASPKGPIVLWRLTDVEELAVDGDQASTKAEGARRRRLAQRLARQPHQQAQGPHAQLPASIAQRRSSRQALRWTLLAQPAQRTRQLRPHLLQGHGGQHGPSYEQVDHDHMIELAFALLPATQVLQDLADQFARIDLFKYGQGDLLACLVSGHLLQYPRCHRKGAFLSRRRFFVSLPESRLFVYPSPYLNGIDHKGPYGRSMHISLG